MNGTTRSSMDGADCLGTEPVPDPETKRSRLYPVYTEAVIGQTGKGAHLRTARVFASIVRHLHAVCREEEVTITELGTAMEFLQKAAQNPPELSLLLGLTGTESLVEEITFPSSGIPEGQPEPTTQTGLGPFYRPGAPLYKNGQSIISGFDTADRVLVHGRVLDATTSQPLPNVELDIWQAGTNSLYDHEDIGQPEWNLRGRFFTNPDGMYSFICLRPTYYPIPAKGTVGTLLKLLDRHPFRPGHIHFKVRAEGYVELVTALYEKDAKYVDSDCVFEVRDSVVVEFEERKGDPKAQFELGFDFRLVGREGAEKKGMQGALEWAASVP